MKTFAKILGIVVLSLLVLKGIQVAIDYYNVTFNKKYIVNEID